MIGLNNPEQAGTRQSMFQIDIDVVNEPQRLTPAVLQAAEMLGMYRAELARVLHLQCGDIGELTSMRKTLQPETDAWQKAVQFVQFFNELYDKQKGDASALCHWLRCTNPELEATPLLSMVDNDDLERVMRPF